MEYGCLNEIQRNEIITRNGFITMLTKRTITVNDFVFGVLIRSTTDCHGIDTSSLQLLLEISTTHLLQKVFDINSSNPVALCCEVIATVPNLKRKSRH